MPRFKFLEMTMAWMNESIIEHYTIVEANTFDLSRECCTCLPLDTHFLDHTESFVFLQQFIKTTVREQTHKHSGSFLPFCTDVYI